MAEPEVKGEAPPKKPKDIASFWQIQLGLADKDQQDWRKDAQAVVARYKNEKKTALRSDGKRFNILFSNTETLKSALYGRTAKPDVRRRFADKDITARTAAEVVERALIDCAEVYDVDKPIEKGLHDYLLPGRGVVRIEYEPVIEERPKIDMLTAKPMLDEAGEPVTEKYIADQIIREKYVYWDDYRQSPARTWDDVWWVAFRHLMTRADLKGNEFDQAEDIPLNWSPEGDEKKRPVPDDLKRAEVWEIWNDRDRERIWIVKGWDSPLRTDEDPYGLEDFFPLPEPLISFGDTATLVPTPEFHTYRDQADDLDECVQRISRLTRALKRRGVYNKVVKELARLKNANDNEFIPVDDWAALQSRGGLKGAFEAEDISIIAEVLKELYIQRDQLIQGIYEVTGIADIMRGSSDPNETLGAQQLKAQFGSTRMKRRQRAVQKWIRDLYKLKAEIIAEHFEPSVLQEMTGQQIAPEVIDLLRSDKMRSYRIDIETDSTIFEDAEQEKQQTVEMLTGVAALLEKGLPVVQEAPMLGPLLFEMISIGLRSFKQGKQLEDIIEQTKDALAQAAQQPKPPTPEAQVADAKLKAIQAKSQADAQGHQLDNQSKVIDLQVHQAKAQTSMQTMQAKAMMPQPQGPVQ